MAVDFTVIPFPLIFSEFQKIEVGLYNELA